MSHAFLDVNATQTVDEYQNSINEATCVIPDGVERVIIRPDMMLDFMTVTLPTAADGLILKITTMENVWDLMFDVPSTTTAIDLNGQCGLSCTQGTEVTLIYVEAEDRWYLLTF